MAENGSVTVLDSDTLVWTARKGHENATSMEDSGIDSDPKQQQSKEDDKNFNVRS